MLADKTFNVTIIDDDLTMREMLSDYFSTHFSISRITNYNSGEEAVAADLNEQDLILLDYHLAAGSDAMNGLQVLKRLNTMYPGIPVIVLSGQEKPEIAANTVKYGAWDYIIKNENAFTRLGIQVNNMLVHAAMKNEAADRRKMVRLTILLATILFIGLLVMKFV